MKPFIWIGIGFLLWLAETWYFGWNEKPSCIAENVCDSIALVFLFTGLTHVVIIAIAKEVVTQIEKNNQ